MARLLMASDSSRSALFLPAVLLATAVGFLAGRYTSGGDVSLSLTRGERADGAPRTGVEAENADLRRRLEELEAERAAHAGAREVADSDRPIEEPPPPPPATPEVAVAALFADARYPALDGVDWKLVGSVTSEMAPLLAQLLEAMEKTGEVPTELAVQIQSLNQKLVEQVPTMMKSGVPGFGPNGSYTHPLITANVLGSTLLASGLPLSDAQRTAIEGLARSFGVENQGIADQPREFELEHLVAEAEMKDRFYAEMSSQLTPEQLARIEPNGATSYDGGSLFRSSLMTRPYVEPVAAKDPADFARIAGNRLGEHLGLDEATTNQVRAVVERMARQSPELWAEKGTTVEQRLRMLKPGRTGAAMRRQLEVMREIQKQVKLTPEQRRRLAQQKQVFVPLPQ